MADDGGDLSPRPFRRERNLSNRNFNRQSARRRFSTESRNSIESFSNASNAAATSQIESSSTSTDTNSSCSAVFSVGSAVRSYTTQLNLRKMTPPNDLAAKVLAETSETPQTPDPAFLDVRQKVERFETLQSEDRIIFKTGKLRFRSTPTMVNSGSPLHVLPEFPTTTSSINEERSEDEVDDFSDYAADEPESLEADYTLPQEPHIYKLSLKLPELSVHDFNNDDTVQRSLSQHEDQLNATVSNMATTQQKGAKDFIRNYRTIPRPKTEVLATKNNKLIGKFNSVYHENDDAQDAETDEWELRSKSKKFVQPILEELIKTEESYVENLLNGIENYGNIFDRKDLPIGLRGKKYVLLGNVEQISEFHRDEFLPMLKRNQHDLKSLFDEFQDFIDQNCFYAYVIFTMNKQRSLKLCDVYKNYFKLIQNELDDKLGINSFLVQPIQRMARYPLLLDQFITTFFKNRSSVDKEILSSCCRLEKKLRNLLITTNESEIINDIVDCNEFNVFYQGKFRKVSEFQVYDYTLRRSYRAKVFIFDKCIIYTEIKGKNLIFHGRYPCEHVGIAMKPKTFTLFYERRKQQECDFSGDPALIELWLELIRDMISPYVHEEKVKLQERYARDNDNLLRKPPSLSLFRDSNRFSADSGIGNIWTMPKPEADETPPVSNRTTWYAVS